VERAADAGEVTMPSRYRKPKLWRSSNPFPGVIRDAPIVSDRIQRRKNTAWKNATRLRKRPTKAEQHLELVLNSLNHGVLQGSFLKQWAFADKWILDFFFFENRLGIEVDGSIHNTSAQRLRDEEKEAACRTWGITLLRVSNRQVFGPEEELVRLLRAGWKQASTSIKSSEFARK
jgi:very-short-patch-repair endonuclease